MSEQRYYIALAIIGLGVVAYVAMVLRQRSIERFRKEATVGVLVNFYHNDSLIRGEIVACDSSQVVIDSDYGTFKRFRADIYPY